MLRQILWNILYKIKPSDLRFGEGDQVVKEIKNSSAFEQAISKIIDNAKGNTLYNDDGITFPKKADNVDLFYAIHNSRMQVSGVLVKGKWILNVSLDDEYDFTELLPFNTLGNTANNMALYSQGIGAIKPYHVYINFTVEKCARKRR